MASFKVKVVLCRIRLFPTSISKIKWLGFELSLKGLSFEAINSSEKNNWVILSVCLDMWVSNFEMVGEAILLIKQKRPEVHYSCDQFWKLFLVFLKTRTQRSCIVLIPQITMRFFNSQECTLAWTQIIIIGPYISKGATLMLVTDSGNSLYWWQL